MGRYLTEVAHFANTPPTLGSLEMAVEDGRVALATLQGYVRNQGDGWQYALDHLSRSFDEAAIGGETDVMQDTGRDAFMAHMGALGQRTAELHRALALSTDDAAFAPESIAPEDINRWRARAHEQADQAVAALKRTAGEEAASFISAATALHERLDELLPETLPIKKTRCHGDYHLGQIVIVQNDIFILDFEGEPTRPLAERRAKRLPLIDVAGMLRSFDYAGWAALSKFGATEEKVRETMLARLEVWKRETAAAFLAGYIEAIGDCPSFPDDPDLARRLITFHALEKACYEITYEAGYRPDWLAIPLKGALHLMNNELEGPWT
jgi:maltose alpha-D-glucosyltransferase/alpha-amylase